MVDWTQLAGKTWQILNCHDDKSSTTSKEEIDYLDYQILRWYNQIPDELQLTHARANPTEIQKDVPHDPLYLPAVLYIRQNYLRNLIYRPILQSGLRIREDERHAHVATEVAKESIRTVWQLNQTTELIGTHPILFKHFVLSSFGNLSLAVVNATSDYWASVRDEFHLALKLIRLLSTRSGPLMRLWKRLQGLEKLQDKISLTSTPATSEGSGSQVLHKASRDRNLPDEFSANFPVFYEPSTTTAADGSAEISIGVPQIRDEFASLFDQAADINAFFDFPFADFGRMT